MGVIAAEGLFRFLDESPHILFFITTDFMKPPVYVNRACELVTGYTREEFLTQITPYGIIHPSEREKARIIFSDRSKIRKGIPHYTFKIITKSGGIRWVKCSFSKIILADGKKGLGGIGIVADEDVKTKEILRSVLDMMDEGVAIMDRDMKIILFNESLRKLVLPHMTHEEIRGKVCYKVVFNRDEPCEDCASLEAFKTSRPKRKIFHVKGRRRERWYELKAKPIFDDTNYPFAVVEYVRDITSQKLREKHLIREERIRTLEQIASGIAHDFNNILAVIMASASTLKLQLAGNPDMEQQVEAIEKACSKARDLIHQFLTFTDEDVHNVKKVNPVPMVEELVKILSKGLSFPIEFEAQQDVWEIEVDPAQLNRVIQNIVLNAIDAVREKGDGKVKVAVSNHYGSTPYTEASERWVKIEISDTGIGMDSNVLNRIFEPFFTTKAGGNGMGLAVAYSILKRYNAHIHVESEPGKGSTFTIYIPAVPEPIADDERRTVLVLEDQPALRRVIRLYLEGKGFVVFEAETGEQALDMAREIRDIDAFILDLNIEEGGGAFEVVEQLKRLHPDAAYILTTGYISNKTRQMAESLGFNGILQKPFKLSELVEILEERNGKE